MEERLKAYHEKKAKKPQVIAKTSVLLDVKPWDDETDHDQMLASVKSIEMDGLLWGAHKLIPIGYGIKKLQVMCTVEDEKVSIEELCEKIEEFEDFVQSCDVNAKNKLSSSFKFQIYLDGVQTNKYAFSTQARLHLI